MLTEVRSHFKLLWKYFKFNLNCSMEYRVGFIVQIIGMIINNSAFLFFWWVLYRNVNTISGYSFSDVMVLWGLTSSTYGIANIVFGNVRELSNVIISGGLDGFLIQPKDVAINVCASRTEVSAWGDFIYGYSLLIIAGRTSIHDILLFTLFVVSGGLVFFSTDLILNSLALYFGNIEITKRVFENFFITFATYPEGIFGKYFRLVFYTLLPVGFMVYLPAGVIKDFSLLRLLIVLSSSFVYLLLSYFIFYNGLKRYESGNLMEGKI